MGMVLCVLFIFMIVAGPRYEPRHGFYRDLASARNAVPRPWANRDDAIRLAVARDGTLYFRNRKSTTKDMNGQMQEWAKDGSERRVYLEVDERALYRDVKAALDCVREAGIEKVVFLVEKQRD